MNQQQREPINRPTGLRHCAWCGNQITDNPEADIDLCLICWMNALWLMADEPPLDEVAVYIKELEQADRNNTWRDKLGV